MTRHFNARTIKAIIIPSSVIVMFAILSWFWDSPNQLKFTNWMLGWTLAIAAVAAFVLSNRISKLEEDEGTAQKSASDKAIAKANEVAAQANERAARADERAAKANERTAELELARVKLEAAVGPRIIGIKTTDPLKPFRGMQVRVFSSNEPEPNRTREQLNGLFVASGWKILESRAVTDRVEDGISIEWGTISVFDQDNPSRDAAEALKSFLKETGIDSKVGWPGIELPPNTLLVMVGAKEENYFSDLIWAKWRKEWQDAQPVETKPAREK